MKYQIDRELFFDTVRRKFGPLTQFQVDGFNRFIDRYESEYIDESDLDTSLRQFAYILGTVWHESAYTMNAIREGANRKNPFITDEQAYARVTNYLRKHGRGTSYATRKNGISYYGRGPIQVTWIDNYRKMSPILGVDLVKNPDLLLVEPYATRSVFEGMQRGTYRPGNTLDRYIKPGSTNYYDAREIVNGRHDDAREIEQHARNFESALFLNPVKPKIIIEESEPRLSDPKSPDDVADEFKAEPVSGEVQPVTWNDPEPELNVSIFTRMKDWILGRLPLPDFSTTNRRTGPMNEERKSWIVTLIKPVVIGLFAWLGISIDPMILDNPSAWGIVALVAYGVIGIFEKFFMRKEIKEVKAEAESKGPVR